MKVEAIQYGDRKVYSVAAFNHGVAIVARSGCRRVWVEGEVTELRRQERWAERLLHAQGSRRAAPASRCRCRAGSSTRSGSTSRDGERVHVYGRPELFEARGDFRLRALTIERFGLGAHLAALERLKTQLAAEGLSQPTRKRPLPLLPRRSGSSPATTPRRSATC